MLPADGEDEAEPLTAAAPAAAPDNADVSFALDALAAAGGEIQLSGGANVALPAAPAAPAPPAGRSRALSRVVRPAEAGDAHDKTETGPPPLRRARTFVNEYSFWQVYGPLGVGLIGTFVVAAAMLLWLVINGVRLYVYGKYTVPGKIDGKIVETFADYDMTSCPTFRDELLSRAPGGNQARTFYRLSTVFSSRTRGFFRKPRLIRRAARLVFRPSIVGWLRKSAT